jgi:hypothetical protein
LLNRSYSYIARVPVIDKEAIKKLTWNTMESMQSDLQQFIEVTLSSVPIQ